MISLMNYGNKSIHPKPIMYEISSIYFKMGDTGSRWTSMTPSLNELMALYCFQ